MPGPGGPFARLPGGKLGPEGRAGAFACPALDVRLLHRPKPAGETMMPVEIYDTAQELMQAAARRMARLAAEPRKRGYFALALSGGSTPLGAYRLMGCSPLRERIPWERVELFWERRALPGPGAPGQQLRPGHGSPGQARRTGLRQPAPHPGRIRPGTRGQAVPG